MLALQVHSDDNIAAALTDLAANQSIEVAGMEISIVDPIPAKHKFALTHFNPGDEVRMYGLKVGQASQEIPTGGLIHTGNISHAVEAATIGERSFQWTPPSVERFQNATFMGYHRDNGDVGTANYWLVVPLVFCENRNLAVMKEALLKPLGYATGTPYEEYVNRLISAQDNGSNLDTVADLTDPNNLDTPTQRFPNVDGIKFLTHHLGCAGSDEDAQTLSGLLSGYITHPNVAGATVLSLGCQKTQIEHLKAEIKKRDPHFSKPLHCFEQQKSVSEKDMLSQALKATFAGVSEANKLTRKPAPLSKLCIGMECGASDGFSGISANPVLGAVADRTVALNGKAILSEFPELCGAEQNLVDRCATESSAKQFLHLMDTYNEAAKSKGSGFEFNPSFGNIADGLTTDAIKSAGAARKGGTSPVNDVLDYPELVTKNGLTLLCTPGGDVESTTAMAGSGANVILFTTGLGTPTGNPITPVLKVSSNSIIAQKHTDMIDFDTGPIIAGASTIDSLSEDLLDLIIRTASGDYKTCAQRLDQDDFIPWKRGLSL